MFMIHFENMIKDIGYLFSGTKILAIRSVNCVTKSVLRSVNVKNLL